MNLQGASVCVVAILSFFYVSIGRSKRNNPILLLAMGILIIFLGLSLSNFMEIMAEKVSRDGTNLGLIYHMAQKLFEAAIIGVGAGVASLAMDVKSERNLAAEVAKTKRQCGILYKKQVEIERRIALRRSMHAQSKTQKSSEELSASLDKKQEVEDELEELHERLRKFLGLDSVEDLEYCEQEVLLQQPVVLSDGGSRGSRLSIRARALRRLHRKVLCGHSMKLSIKCGK